MNFLQACAPHLPYLRRFARSLTGSQQDGDNYVKITLEALASGEVEFNNEISPKLALYRMFLGIWNSTGAQLEVSDAIESADTPDERVKKLPPLPRQILLLNALEGFTNHEISIIMDVTEEEAKNFIKEADREIEQELRTNVVIIEDEPIIAADIEGLVEELGHSVDGIAATHSEALRLVQDKKPGIVLSDIQLADGSSGIDAVNDILAKYNVPVIFITAFPERLLTGTRPEPAHLITKPFRPNNVKAAISQALFFHRP